VAAPGSRAGEAGGDAVNARPRFYNPREASPEVLEAMLVGRKPIVDEILADLARQASAATRQHWLIRGPRGIGKTHLIGIVYHRVKQHGLSEAYLPIWLAESEAYSVYSAAVLLLHVAQQLVVELQQSGDSGEVALQARIADLEQGGDDPALFEELVQLLRDEARSRGKILLVLMENLDAALAGMPGRRGTGQVQRLRSLLSEDKEFLFLSTTPTRYLAALLDPRQPLYGQLKERTLQPLAEEEVGQLLTRLAEVTGQPAKAGFEGPEPEFRVRRRVLHRLTGGNPRAVVMAFSVLTGNPGVQAIVEEMSALLDAQTAYFEARLAQLAPRERAVVAAMATAPENLTLKEIAQRSRLPLRALSTQVKRLQEQGYVVPVAGEGGKGTLYELGDGLFRLWYQFRKGTKVLAPIVRFLALWHPVAELEEALAELRSTGGEDSLLQRDLIRLTARQIEAAVEVARSHRGKQLREALWEECSRIPQADDADGILKNFCAAFRAFQVQEYDEASDYLEGIADASPRSEREAELIGLSMILLGMAREQQDRKQDAVDLYRGFYQRLRHAPGGSEVSTLILIKLLSYAAENQDVEELEFLSTKLLYYVEEGTKLFEGDFLVQLVLLLRSVSLVRSDSTRALLLLAEMAGHPTATDTARASFVDSLPLLVRIGVRWPSEARQVLTSLAASGDAEVSKSAEIYRFVLDGATALLGGRPSQARRALARVPAELRQTVSDLAEQVVAAERDVQSERESPAKSGGPPPKSV
jgi:DNA-binding MarR family transcriptional regulator